MTFSFVSPLLTAMVQAFLSLLWSVSNSFLLWGLCISKITSLQSPSHSCWAYLFKKQVWLWWAVIHRITVRYDWGTEHKNSGYIKYFALIFIFLMICKIFSCAYLPFIYLFWWNIWSSLLTIKKIWLTDIIFDSTIIRAFPLKSGIRQRYSLSLILFNIVSEELVSTRYIHRSWTCDRNRNRKNSDHWINGVR